MDGFSEIFAMLPQILGGVSSGIGLVKNIMGAGDSKQQAATPATIPPPQAASTITGSAVAPGTSPTDFTKSQNAYWQQLMSGLGQGQELPANIQSNIEKQASLL